MKKVTIFGLSAHETDIKLNPISPYIDVSPIKLKIVLPLIIQRSTGLHSHHLLSTGYISMSKNTVLGDFGGSKMPQIKWNPNCEWIKHVFLVVSIHFQQFWKVAQNSNKNDKLVIIHQVDLIFT